MFTVLIGAAGAGKSTVAARQWGEHQIVSLDALRGLAGQGPWDQAATPAAVAALRLLVRARLHRRIITVVDATNAGTAERAMLLEAASEAGVPADAVVILPPLEVCLARNAARPAPAAGARWGPRVPGPVVRQQYERIQAALPGLRAERFQHGHRAATGRAGTPRTDDSAARRWGGARS